MTDRTILLDVDGVLLAQGGYNDALSAFLTGATSYQPEWMRTASRRAFDWVFPNGARIRRGVCPQALSMLRDAHRHGVRVLWSSSWLVDSSELTRLADALGLQFVELPGPEELVEPPSRNAIPAPPRDPRPHFKVKMLHAVLAATSGEVLMIDDHGPEMWALYADPDDVDRVSCLRPYDTLGLGPEDASRIRRWARGGPLPR